MVVINLLPWREYRDLYQLKNCKKKLLISISIALLMVCVTHIALQIAVRHALAHSSRLQKELQQLARIKSRRQESHNANLDEMRYVSQHVIKIHNLFGALGKRWQENVCFTEFSREKNAIVFKGSAETAEEFTAFLKHWRVSHLFSTIKIESLQYQDSLHAVQFRFRALENQAA